MKISLKKLSFLLLTFITLGTGFLAQAQEHSVLDINTYDETCTERVINRSGTIDMSCQRRDPLLSWACYEDIEIRCESSQGTRTYNIPQRMTGQCAASFSDCW